MYDNSGPHLDIELFDEDTDKDDFLGRYRPGMSTPVTRSHSGHRTPLK